MIGKVLKSSEVGKSYDLPPRLFRQSLEPLRVLPFNSDLLDFDKEQFYQKDTARRVYGHCTAHYFDNDKKKCVEFDLGPVNVICRTNVYRAAPSAVLSPEFDDEPKNVLSWGEGAAPCAIFSAVASEGGPAAPPPRRKELLGNVIDKCQSSGSGFYVIPGQTIPWDKNAQKTGGQTPTDGNN